MANKIRIKDIAAQAGVSVGTVDRVIHERGKVSESARSKVLAVMKKLNFEPNIIASTLASNRSLRYASLLPDPLIDPYWNYPKQGVESAVKAVAHYGIQLEQYYFNLFDPSTFVALGNQILANPPDALLLSPLFLKESKSLLQELSQFNIPVSFINTDIEGHAQVLSYVGQNSYQSGYLAAKLFQIGKKEASPTLVLHIGKETTNAPHLSDKQKGIFDYYDKHFGEHSNVAIHHFSDLEKTHELRTLVLDLKRSNPGLKNIFITNSRAYKLLDTLSDKEIDQFNIIGFDLLEKNLKYLAKEKINFLINQNPAQQGYWGIMNLVNNMLFKKEVKRLMYLPLDIVVAENARYYVERENQYII